MEIAVVKAARAAHEANRVLCLALGDDSQPRWEDAPEWQKSSAINGPVKNPETKEHPCFVPYNELPPQQRLKDEMFGLVVRAALQLTILILIIGGSLAVAEEPAAQPVKDTPALKQLVKLSKDKKTDQAAFDAQLKQAQQDLKKKQDDISVQMQSATKDLYDEASKDKRLKPLVDKITGLGSQYTKAQVDAQQQFSALSNGLQQKIASETAQAQVLIGVVKSENDFPDDATFDMDAQKWTIPKATPKK